MSTKVLVDLTCTLYEETYGPIGAKILRTVLERNRITAFEISKLTGLARSAVQRTLISLITNRFVLFWQHNSTTFYFGNWWEVYTILWTGQFTDMVSAEAKEILLKTVVEGPITLDEETSQANPHGVLRELGEVDFWPRSELVDSLTEKHQRIINNDPATMSLSETAKKQQVSARVNDELSKIQLNSKPSAQGASKGKPQYVPDWDKFLVRARNIELEQFAKRRIGVYTGEVYAALLKLSLKSCFSTRQNRSPNFDTTVTSQQICGVLRSQHGGKDEQGLSLGERLAKAFVTDLNNDGPSSKKQRIDNNELMVVNRHLTLLQECISVKFVVKVGDRGGGEWFVPFNEVVASLQSDVFDRIVSHSFGHAGARLLRLIRQTGKLDEKMLAHQALLPAAEVRQHMSGLGECGFVEIQELAKPGGSGGSGGPGGAASQKRSMYLWYHNPSWAYKQLTGSLYVQQSELLAKRKELYKQHASLVAKLARADVASEPDQFLTENEKVELQELKSGELELFKKINLLDRHIRIFREY